MGTGDVIALQALECSRGTGDVFALQAPECLRVTGDDSYFCLTSTIRPGFHT